MEFQAYPTVPVSGRKSQYLCKVQRMLHGEDSILVPCAILMAAGGLVLFEHARQPLDTTIRNFMAMVVITMVPLAFLEKKVLAAADPVGLISKFSSPVLLLHACFLAIRAMTLSSTKGLLSLSCVVAIFSTVVAVIMLPVCFGFRFTAFSMREHGAVGLVLLVALVAAVVTEASRFNFAWSDAPSFTNFVRSASETGTEYVEALAFMPAVCMACRSCSSSTGPASPRAQAADVVVARRRAVAFFAWLLSFYFVEDVVAGFSLMWVLPLAAAAHAAHYFLLVDFAGFLLANLYDPEKLKKVMGDLMNIVADACSV